MTATAHVTVELLIRASRGEPTVLAEVEVPMRVETQAPRTADGIPLSLVVVADFPSLQLNLAQALRNAADHIEHTARQHLNDLRG